MNAMQIYRESNLISGNRVNIARYRSRKSERALRTELPKAGV